MRNLLFSILLFITLIAHVKLLAQCNCIESDDFLADQLLLCESFELYNNFTSFPSDNANWTLLPGTTSLAQIQTPTGSGKSLSVREIGSNKPSLLLKLGNKTAGRYRLSWRTFIPKGKTAKYNVQHLESANHLAFSVKFGADGIGSAEILGNTVSQFPYLIGAWNKVMHIVDLDEDLVELWINDEFVDIWKFSLAYNASEPRLKQLGAVNFFTEGSTSEYYVDDICMWQPTQSIVDTSYNPVCIKNGETIQSLDVARFYRLFTLNETLANACTEICDLKAFGAIYRSRTRGKIDENDLLVNSFLKNSWSCISELFPEKTGKQFQGKSYTPYIKNGGIFIEVLEGDVSDVRVFIYDCLTGECYLPYEIKIDTNAVISSFFENIPEGLICVVFSSSPVKYLISSLEEGEGWFVTCDDSPYKELGLNSNGVINFTNKYYENYREIPDKSFLGAEAYYSFILDEPMFVELSAFASGTGIGMILYPNPCGIFAIATSLSESDSGGTASIQTWLSEGRYFVKIDQVLDLENVFCNVDIKASLAEMNLNQSSDTSCISTSLYAHKVTVRANPLYLDGNPLSISDKIYLINRDKNTNSIVRALNWNGLELNFLLPNDEVADSKKCGYSVDEPIDIYVTKGDNVFEVTPVYQPIDGIEITATSKFKNNGKSLITGFYSKSNASVFSLENIPRLTSNASDYEIRVSENANKSWTIKSNAIQSNWVTINPLNGIGNQDLAVSVLPNVSTTFRSDTVFLIREDGITRYIILEQPGCVGPSVNAGPDQSLCANQPINLTATGVGTISWQTPDRSTISGTMLSPIVTGTQIFTAIATLNGCTDTDSITVFIRPKPVVTLAESRLIFGPTGFLKMNVNSGTPGYRYQWFRNDTLISTQKDLFGLRTGIYKLIVTDAIGCSATFGPQAIVTTSTFDLTLSRNIQIFPNPSTELIYLQFDLEQSTPLEISILDALGKNIWHQGQRNFFREKLEINLSNHPAGMYWVQFKTENGAFYKKIMRL